jgi:cyclic 2,3-diphosphoglycerate synthetase
VISWAVEEIEACGATVRGLLFIGGTEKIEDPEKELTEAFQRQKAEHSDIPGADLPLFFCSEGSDAVRETVTEILSKIEAGTVLDLSDEPVVSSRFRFRIASELIEQGLRYIGADFYFKPPAQPEILEKAGLCISGSGKRVGKTALSVYTARLLAAEGIKPLILTMGRGGPRKPEYIDPAAIDLDVDYLLRINESGRHAASDYWEDACLSGVQVIGCRRCGGGMAGNPFISNIKEGAALANTKAADIVIAEGSGPTLPPLKTDLSLHVISAEQDPDDLDTFFDLFKLQRADIIIVTGSEEPWADEGKLTRIEYALHSIRPNLPIFFTVFRPEPLGDITGKKVFFAAASNPEIVRRQAAYIEEEYGASIVFASPHLSDREALAEDLKEGLADSEILLTELKAASVDQAAETAGEFGVPVIFLQNRPAPRSAGNDPAETILQQVKMIIAGKSNT